MHTMNLVQVSQNVVIFESEFNSQNTTYTYAWDIVGGTQGMAVGRFKWGIPENSYVRRTQKEGRARNRVGSARELSSLVTSEKWQSSLPDLQG